MTTENFFIWEAASRDTIDVKRCYVDMADDLVAGILLSQIVYWHLPGRGGETKLTVDRNGHSWMACKRDDWWGQCRITPKQFDRSVELLEQNGLVVTGLFKFNGSPTKHLRLEMGKFLDVLTQVLDTTSGKSILTKGQNPNVPKVNIHIDQRLKSYCCTKTTTETTPESTVPGGLFSEPLEPVKPNGVKANGKAFSGYTEDFEAFWAAYPRRVGKGKAFESWKAAGPPKIESLLPVLEAYKKTSQWIKDGGQFIPHPTTWLNQRRFDDDPSTDNGQFKGNINGKRARNVDEACGEMYEKIEARMI